MRGGLDRAVDRLGRLERRRRRGRSGRFVSVGLSSYSGSGQRDLPATEREAKAVAAIAGDDAPLLGESVTCDRLLASLPGARGLHVAAHGSFDPIEPARSGVLLRDGARRYRRLSLSELRRADLSRLRLATLATCHSAESARLPGRERICLPTALLDAGARGVIASLWPVEDEPSVHIMTALYERLRTERAAEALAGMQRTMRKCGRPARQWAGLIFYGND